MGDFELCQSHHGVSFCSEWVGLETQAKAAQGAEASHKLFFPPIWRSRSGCFRMKLNMKSAGCCLMFGDVWQTALSS